MVQDANRIESFTTLYRHYAPKVYRLCFTLTKHPQLAQDCTQDIFLKVLSKIDSFNNRSTFSTWLYAITYNYCMDQIRVQKRLTTELLSDEVSNHVPDAGQSETIDWQLTILDRVLQHVRDEDVTLLRLKYERGISLRDLSQQYGVSEGALKMRLKRTRDEIRKLLSRPGASDLHA
ncbi:RNA polymerase sigma factor [Fibrisoma montanum]|nr:sigma-70 family RNA polymerase sigma factor [Fibrisoma montanum]